ncbi:MAG: Flp family type IVb pilin [Amaricoccus sp.]
MHLLRTFAADDSGATAIEYALIAGLVVVGVIGAMTTFGQSAGALMTHVADAVTAASAPH